METIKIGKIEKCINSTARSFVSGATVFTQNVCLKEGSTIEAPTFIINSSISYARLAQYNYIKWETDDSQYATGTVGFYWITSRKFVHNNLIEISCEMDILATFRSAITTYDGFIARSSNGYDTMITDPNILTKPILVKEASKSFALVDLYTEANIFDYTDGNVSYTWTTIGTNGCSIFNTPSQPNNTLYEMLNLQGGSVWQNFEWGVTNPGQYVKDCILLPFAFTSTDYGSHKIYIGNLTADITDAYVWEGEASSGGSWDTDSPDRFYQRRMLIDIHDSDLSLAYPNTDFRNYDDRFTNIKMRIPYVGLVDIPAKHLKAHDLYLSYTISAMTGKGKAELLARYGDETPYKIINIGTYNIETGIPVAVAAGHTNQLQMARDVVQGVKTAGEVAGAVTVPTPASVINATANVMGTALETAAHAASGYQEFTFFGSNGSLMETFVDFNNVYVYIQQYDSTSTDFVAERGRPVYDKTTPTINGGFYQWLAPSVKPAGATAEQISAINNYMASGIYVV